MSNADDNAGMGWDGEGRSSPTEPPAPQPATTAADSPTVAQPAAAPPTPPPPPQPMGVPAPTPGDPAQAAAPGAAAVGAPGVGIPGAPPAPAPYPAPGTTGPIPAVAAPGYQGPPPGAAPSNRGLWIALAILGTIVVIGAVVAVVLLLRGSDTTTSETLPATSASSSTTSSTTQPASTAPVTTAPTATVASPPPETAPSSSAIPSGLYCRDLEARGLSYADAVRYYKREGYPDRMDADGNGIPCETVYSASSVQAYWGTVRSGSTLGLPSGLLCRDLHDRGLDYASAVDYWIADGYPDRMDADHNGIPCETVYSAVEVRGFWDMLGE